MAMKVYKSLIFLALLPALIACGQAASRQPQAVPFPMPAISLPSIPAGEVVLTDFGAVGDGVTLVTEAFEMAFDALEQRGGGPNGR